MLDAVFMQLHKHASGRKVALLFGLVVACNVLILPAMVGSITPIDLRLFYSAQTVHSVAEAVAGSGGLAPAIVLYLTVDTFYPLLYTAFLALAITWTLRGLFVRGHRIYCLALLPFGALVFDWSENLGMVWILAAYPTRLPALAWAVSVFTALKWLFVSLCLLALAAALILAAAQRWQARSAR